MVERITISKIKVRSILELLSLVYTLLSTKILSTVKIINYYS